MITTTIHLLGPAPGANDSRRYTPFTPDALESQSSPVRPYDVWRDLIAGTTSVVAYHNTDRCCYVELERKVSNRALALDARQQQMLERLLLGQCSKVLAFDASRSISTVSSLLGQALGRLGLPASPRQVPLFMVLLVHAALQQTSPELLDSRVVQADALRSLLVMRRIDARLLARLSPAELAVIRGVVDGHSHTAIAESRGASLRTIANQIATAYAKLRVSGRLDLLGALARELPPLAEAK